MASDASIPVIWHEGTSNGDKRSWYDDAVLMNETFDGVRGFTHHSTFAELPEGSDGAIIVVHGGNEQGRADSVLMDAETLKWSIIVVLCDDESAFNTRLLQAPNRKLWQQMPIPGKHDFCDRFLICGYPNDIHRELAKCRDVNRDLDWFFAGQVTHSRRHHCVKFLDRIPNGTLVKTAGFSQGLSREEYYRTLRRCKIAPCPGGPVTPDTIRVAEALEAGCVPLVDMKPGNRGQYPNGYWKYVLKQDPPFRVVNEWFELPVAMQEELAAFPQKTLKLQEWWANYKRSMQDWLRQDIEELRTRCE